MVSIPINGEQLKVYRCHKTDLLMMDLTEGLTHLTLGAPVDIPKAHRRLRAMLALDETSMSVVGFHNQDR